MAAPETLANFVSSKACRYGEMMYLAHDYFVGRSFDLYGEFSEEEVKLWRNILKPGMVALDIGANIGAHTVPLAQMVYPGGGVIAFEPQPFIFQMLCGNVARNGLQHVICERSIVADKPGVAQVHAIDYREHGNFGGYEVKGSHAGMPLPTNVTTVDSFRLAACDLIKVDVEGMEQEVLIGAARTIRQHRPYLYVECDRDEHRLQLFSLLGKYDYDVRWHEPPLYNPDNFAGEQTNVFDGIVSRNLICCPK